MNIPRESIYVALFELVSLTPGLVTASRRFRMFSEMQPEEMPALFQVQTAERAIQQRGLPPKWELSLDLFLYVAQSRDPNQPSTTVLNAMIDYLVNALAPTNGNATQTLGNLVHHAWISGEAGKIEIFEGVFQNVTVATVPVSIFTAA